MVQKGRHCRRAVVLKSMRNSEFDQRAVIGLTAAGILTGAFLLFQLQPLIGKAILPWFGGSTLVWSTSLVFFQVTLLAGYGYAHMLVKSRSRFRWLFHAGLLVAAAITLPLVPSADWEPTDGGDPVTRILQTLTFSVGPPFFILASTGPLLQAIFAQHFPSQSPYRLYALSNAGSLAALLTYPVLVEPFWTLGIQDVAWCIGFLIYSAILIRLLLVQWRAPVEIVARSVTAQDKPGALSVLLWLLLPALASALLLTITQHVCQDVASVPFLWVVPLALYLLSFILCFEHPRWYQRNAWTAVTMLCSLLLAAVLGYGYLRRLVETVGLPQSSISWLDGLWSDLVISLATLFLAAVVCHGERLPPATCAVTAHGILSLSVHGRSFGWIVGGDLLSAVVRFLPGVSGARQCHLSGGHGGVPSRKLAPLARHPSLAPRVSRPHIAGGHQHAVCWLPRTPPHAQHRQDAGIFMECYASTSSFATAPRFKAARFIMAASCTATSSLRPERRREPTTYFARQSGIGLAIDALREERQRPLHVAVIGLGAGTLLGYAEADDRFEMYDIDVDVMTLAERYFTFIDDARARGAEVVLTVRDGRLGIKDRVGPPLDLLIVDAFSGDAIPTHLITQEAIEVYRGQLAQDGLVALHISNRYLDLRPVTRGLAEAFDMSARIVHYAPEWEDFPAIYLASSDWVLLSPAPQLFESSALAEAGRRLPDSVPSILWTDQFSNLLQVIR